MKKKQFNINIEEFKNYLGIYGSDINRWPEDIRGSVRSMINSSAEVRKMVEEERAFEEKLNFREVEPHSAGLEERIIASAKNTKALKSGSFISHLSEMFRSFHLPNPAFSLTAMLIAGIMLGYFTSTINPVNSDDQLITSQFAIYDGEIYEFED